MAAASLGEYRDASRSKRVQLDTQMSPRPDACHIAFIAVHQSCILRARLGLAAFTNRGFRGDTCGNKP